MKVGILGECSGQVRDAFLRRGHDAISCDLKPTESPGPHIQGDYMIYSWSGFDLLICHPDCTYLCASGLHWNKRRPERQKLTDQAVLCVTRIWELDVPRMAIENPIGCLSTRFARPSQIIQPWQFGEDASKATCLWLRGLPALRPTGLFPPRIVNGKRRWSNQTDSGQNRLGPSLDRAAIRAETYFGIAEAMADQWGSDALSVSITVD